MLLTVRPTTFLFPKNQIVLTESYGGWFEQIEILTLHCLRSENITKIVEWFEISHYVNAPCDIRKTGAWVEICPIYLLKDVLF